jgi:Glycosyltransferase
MSPSQVLTPVDRVEEALSAIRHEVAALRADVRAVEQELQRVARGHASNARSIRGHADELRRLGDRSDALRLDRQLRAIPSRGRRRIARRLGRDDAISQSPTISPTTAASRVAGPPTVLIVANAYPTTAREYGGQHIARRVPHYRRAGYGVVVFVPTDTNDRRDVVDALGARVIVGPIDSLPQRIAALGPAAIAVHSPLPETWAVVKPATDDIATFVWIHGFEARDWRSLSFDYTLDEIERDGPRLDAVNTERRRVLTEIFGNRSVETIFVSSFMRTVAEDFVGVQADRGHVIHNVIDPTVFQYREKSAGDRFKIVSVRSFDRRNYGTDLVSLAVQRLRRERWFDDLAVTIVGEGRYFESDTAPLAGIPQVQLRRQLLQAVELDELFAGNGISLCPTRWDSQGMVMGESMSCGLVPVTNGVTAIPEFVDETTAALTGPEDDAGLAAAIAEMIDDPDLFLSRSRAAHARVVQQCGPEQTVRRELDLFDRALL